MVPYAGSLTASGVGFIGIDNVMDFWARNNNCDLEPTIFLSLIYLVTVKVEVIKFFLIALTVYLWNFISLMAWDTNGQENMNAMGDPMSLI